jgi:folate-dependent phosphoribosylglycinamide formyltransferase PurN
MHEYMRANSLPVQIALAVFTRADSPAYALAQSLGINSVVISAKDMRVFEAQVTQLCTELGVSLIALAGFLKQLSAEFIATIAIPILNIHPALLPKYGGKGMYGMAVHKAVWEAGESISGASIHLVDPLYDHGLVIASEEVSIAHCQSPEEIAQTVLKVEHRLYAKSILHFLSLANR